MSSLYGGNTLACWSGPNGDRSSPTWPRVVHSSVDLLPSGQVVLARGGWSGLMEHILGEAQFGAHRYRMGWPRRTYYRLKPLLPRAATTVLRRGYARRQPAQFSLSWPVEDRFVHFLHGVLNGLGATPTGFWPNSAAYSFALTHDVERAEGQAFVPVIADPDERYGFRSSFNFV